jgi:hypothetical protein
MNSATRFPDVNSHSCRMSRNTMITNAPWDTMSPDSWLGLGCDPARPRLYDCSMVTQITLKTERPHGLPSDRGPRRLIRQRRRSGYACLAWSCFIFSSRIRLRQRFTLERLGRARTQRLVREASGVPHHQRGPVSATIPAKGLGFSLGTGACSESATFFVRVSLAGIEPVGFRVKSDLRNHRAIVQPTQMPQCRFRPLNKGIMMKRVPLHSLVDWQGTALSLWAA